MPVVTLTKDNSVAYDAFIRSDQPTSIYATTGSGYIGVDASAAKHRMQLFFGLGLVPNDAVINSAKLKFQQFSNSPVSIDVHPLTASWDASTLTWNTQTPFDANKKATGTSPSAASSFEIDVTSIVQSMVNGDYSNGFLLKATDELKTNANLSTVYSTDYSTVAYRPTLTIDYTIPSTGKKQVEYVGAGTKVPGTAGTQMTFSLPSGYQAGDMLIAHIYTGSLEDVTIPAGWTAVQNNSAGTYMRYTVATKIAATNEVSPTFSKTASTVWIGAIFAFRNVKQVIGSSQNIYSSPTTKYSPPPITVTKDDTAFVIFDSLYGPTGTFSDKKNFIVDYENTTGGTIQVSHRYMYNLRTLTTAEMESVNDTTQGASTLLALEPIVNNPPTLTLSSPANNLLGTDGSCEQLDKLEVLGGTAILDNTRKTQGTNSLKITKTSAGSFVYAKSDKYIKPSVGDCFLAIADGYLENAAAAFYMYSTQSGVTLSTKNITPTSAGYSTGTMGQFIPLISAFKVNGVTTPGTSYFYPRVYHSGTIGHVFNVDAFRIIKITQEEFDALATSVDLATAQAIAAQYPYSDGYPNQTLAEGNSYPVEGTASDADSGNVVTVKYQINNGPVRALQSGVSDGSTPISFARNLVYRNKRIWDGSIDVAGVDLAENTDHTFKVWSEDDQGGKSAEVTRNFRVIHNRPPVISGSNEDLGTIMVPPTKTYTVTEPEANPFTVTEKINGTVIRSFPGVAGRDETVTIPHDLWIRLDLDTPHTLTVEATDSQGMMSTRTFIFIRTETHIEFLLNFDNPAVAAHFTPDGMPKRVLVTLERYIPPGASIESVKVCNNALDAEPTWEDATAAVVAGRGYLFTNQTKTADNWRINIWVVIAKGTATERVRLDGLGGAFD